MAKQNKLNRDARAILGTRQKRTATVARAAWDPETRTVPLAFSSTAPFERFWGIEILDHSPGAVRMNRLKDGAAVLENHDTDKRVGAIKSASIDADEFGRAEVRLSRNQRGEDIARDIEDDIPPKVSVGYIVHEMKLEKEVKDGPDVYRVTDWEPYEISFVAVPADPSVGVGRSMDNEKQPEAERAPELEETIMSDEIKKTETPAAPEAPKVDVSAERDNARHDEEIRVRGILSVGEKFGFKEKANKAVQDGTPLVDFQRFVFDSFEIPAPKQENIGLTENEAKDFSFIRLINAKADPGNIRLQEAAAYELECSRAVEDKLGRKAQGAFIPDDVLYQRRDFIAGPGGTGQYLVGTSDAGQSFIDMLRNRMMVMKMGATEIRGLKGDFAVSAMTSAHTAYWVAESGEPTESKPVMGQRTMSPKTIGAYNDISRKLLIQSSPDAEALVRSDIATVLALGADRAALHGAGSANEPAGIAVTAGVGSVEGGVNGAAPTWAHIVKLQTEVAQDNGDIGAAGYLTSAKIRGKLLQVFINTTGGDTPLWVNDPANPGWGILNGMRAGVSNQISDTLTKGNQSLSSAIFYSGNWSDLIFGYWSGVDLTVDPYTGSSAGAVRVVGLQDMDVMVRRPQCFSAMLDALSA